MKSFEDISWKVDETTYRENPALSYSTLARFDREGFNNIESLYDKVESPSLNFGSAVDALITGGKEEFDNLFMVAEFPQVTESVLKVVKAAFEKWSIGYKSLNDIPSKELLSIIQELNYQPNWKPETRVKVVKEQGNEYYSLMYAAGNRKIINSDTKNQIDATVEALKTSLSTKYYFEPNNPFSKVKRYYQLKFKATFNDIDYRCMADLIIVDYEKKIIYPIDLKTSSHMEWDFPDSFIQWRYSIQARLYWKIIRYNMDKDDYFKDFTLEDYKFIVVNKKSLTPLVWEYPDTKKEGTLTYGENGKIKVKDPLTLGEELYGYLLRKPKVPNGISVLEANNIVEQLNSN